MKTLLILALAIHSIAAALTAPCSLKWDPQSDAVGFRVFRGIDQVADVSTNRATVDLPTDRTSTLTVIAYNDQGISEPSDPITVKPITPQDSQDMLTWQSQRTFFVPNTPKRFFRFSFPTDH